ncbi:ead/Ea22-like family protein [Salmonella enterica subsp. diarizonae]|nr:ead/Ea22-like family protein [Salmonella enterica subsp. diarizonae]EDQ7903636.1 ead/Ea22-like family protein [Salmonella enterica subsp. diarizonae]
MTIDKQALREELSNPAIGSKDHLRKLALSLLDELDVKEEQRANWFQMAQKLGEDLDAAERRIAELEGKLETADKLQDSAFRHGLQHGFSYGQTNNQAGLEQCLSAYGSRGKNNG